MKKDLRTLCVRPFDIPPGEGESVTSPVFPSTAYAFGGEGEVVYPGFFTTYNQKRLGAIISSHEGGTWGAVFNSGMAAITVALQATLAAGDHLILGSPLYGGTIKLVTDDLSRHDISYSFAGGSVESFRDLVKPETKVIFVETPSNPLLTITSLSGISALAREHGIITIADNTLASSVNQKPIEHGFDVSIQSGTKWLGGHNDLQFGTLVLKDEALRADILRVATSYGASLSPELCYQAERSMKTLALRVHRQNENAIALAQFLATHHLVDKVYYPGLENHPGYTTARAQMTGWGGLLSFRLKADQAGVEVFFKALRLITPAISFGGVESVICQPARTSHRDLSAEARTRMGITDGLVRLSAGIESVQDMIADVSQALECLSRHIDSMRLKTAAGNY